MQLTASSSLRDPPNDIAISPPNCLSLAILLSKSSATVLSSKSYVFPHVGLHGSSEDETMKERIRLLASFSLSVQNHIEV